METIVRTNIKRAKVFFPHHSEENDIYIENGIIKIIRGEVRQGIFSGVYELDADGRFAVPVCCDCGCFLLGSKRTGYELPGLNEREFKRFGFFSFVTTLNAYDKNTRLFDQREQAAALNKQGFSVRYLTGGLKNKAYHINENIYQDMCKDPACIGAAVLFDDNAGSIEPSRLDKLCAQTEAAAFDTDTSRFVVAFMGDLAADFGMIEDIIALKSGRRQTVVPWFMNRNRELLNAGIRHIRAGGRMILVAGPAQAEQEDAFIPLWMALIRIYEEQGNLEGILASSFSGGFLPEHDRNALPQRGELVYLIENLKRAVREGIPFEEIIKVLCFNPIDAFGMPERLIEENKRASLLIMDDALNISFLIDGDRVISPDSFKSPVLFL